MGKLLNALLSGGAKSDLKRYRKVANRAGDFEDAVHALDDDELRAKTKEFRERLANGEEIKSVEPEAFAVVRESGVRHTGKRLYDVQLMAAAALVDGHIAEAETGSGKTYSAMPAAYLMALSGKGSHVVTVNDYLAGRDAADTGRVQRALGLTIGLVQNGTKQADRKLAYMADITYGTNTEFGFDYLRDNMALSLAVQVQRGHHFAIVDEADSILIDEARTPLIISGDGAPEAKAYVDFARAVATLDPKRDVEVDEARKTVVTTDAGLSKVERQIGEHIFADASGTLANHLQQALKARFLFQRDRDYIVDSEGKVQIVDEFTGRVLEGRRYSEGLHQAIEAKENVKVNEESRTVASITLQNYFRMYDVLAGMTGTAMTSEAELRETYGTTVTVIPPNVPSIRQDDPDRIYATADAKWRAVVADVKARHAKGQPCLIGTASVESSESLSRMLSRAGVRHNVLNAKQNAREAEVVAEAGRLGAVTVATNMAGRGTDILLGGNPEMLAVEREQEMGYSDDDPAPADVAADVLAETREQCSRERDKVVAAGGLAVIGTERHEARRIDDQLRGRAGRQGDPGETVFYVSLEDDLIRHFGDGLSDTTKSVVTTTVRNAVGNDESQPLQSKAISRQIERAQQRVEDSNYAIRKNVVEYDDIVSRQRESVYGARQGLLEDPDDVVVDTVLGMADRADDRAKGRMDDEGYTAWLTDLTGDPEIGLHAAVVAENDYLGDYAGKVERDVALRVTDARWTDYLSDMEGLKNAIGLRGYGQRDPLVEYRQEARRAFDQLQASIDEGVSRVVVRVRLTGETTGKPQPRNRAERRRMAKMAKREGRHMRA